jgi:hypothetical protein
MYLQAVASHVQKEGEIVMIKIFAVLFAVVYVRGVIICATNNYKMNKLKNILISFLDATKITIGRYYSRTLTRSENYSKAKNKLLGSYPLICYVLPEYSNGCLSYDKSDFELHDTTEEIYNAVLMKHNFVYYNLRSSFLPFNTLKTISRLPSSFVKWLGINHSNLASRIINLIGWIASFIIGIYSLEIKDLITLLINKLSN